MKIKEPLQKQKTQSRIKKISPLEKWRNENCPSCNGKCNVTEKRLQLCISCDLINILKNLIKKQENLKVSEVDKS